MEQTNEKANERANEKPYSEAIYNAISQFLTEHNQKFVFDEQYSAFRFTRSLIGRLKTLDYIVFLRDEQYCVYAPLPFGAAIGDRRGKQAVAEQVCRANYDIEKGCFQFNMKKGDLRFKYCVDCAGITPTAEMVRGSLQAPITAFQRCGADLLSTVFRGKNSLEAGAQRQKPPAEFFFPDAGTSFFGAEPEVKEDAETMLARLSARFRAAVEGSPEEGERSKVKTELFQTKGGADE